MTKRALEYHEVKPSNLLNDNPSKSVAKVEFARRLNKYLTERGWNQSELARAASKYYGKDFGRYNISQYVNGRTLPGPQHLKIIAQALGVKPSDLLPTRGVPTAAGYIAPLDVRDLGNGKVRLRVDQDVDWDVALKIMALVQRKAE